VTVVRPTELDALIDRRRALGHDRFDEVWAGEYRMIPGPRFEHGYVDHQLALVLEPYVRAAGLSAGITVSLGSPDDYRVPDRAYFQAPPTGPHLPTAEIVVEVLAAGDQATAKFGFYAGHGVREIIVADPIDGTVQIHAAPDAGGYTRTDRSELLGVTATELVDAVDWP
jgi:hypothetical protein